MCRLNLTKNGNRSGIPNKTQNFNSLPFISEFTFLPSLRYAYAFTQLVGKNMNYDERITELESRVAFQEDALDKLSDVIAQQDKTIMDLEKMIRVLHDQVKKVDHSGQSGIHNEPPPPHY